MKERRSRALSSKTTAAPPPRKKGSDPAPASAAGERERARDPERTRASLLDAAEEEFGARGFHGARVRSIVDAAGCNDRMLYHYFGDKEGLYRAVIERGLSITAVSVREAMVDADSSDVVALFERVLLALAAAFGDRPSFTRLLVHEALNDFRSFPALSEEIREPFMMQLLPLWAAAVARGEVRSDADPRIALVMGPLLALMWPISIPRIRSIFPERDLDTKASLEWARARMIDVLLRGLTAAKKKPSAR